MNTKIIITGLIVIFLLTCGCAEKKQTTSDEIKESHDTIDVAPDINEVIAEDNVSNESNEVASISQEELDDLKAELEDMEFDDLGGLSE